MAESKQQSGAGDALSPRPILFIESAGGGGAERLVYTLAREFQARELNPLVLSLRRGWLTESLQQEGIRHMQIPSTHRNDFSLIFRLARVLRKENCRLLHCHSLDSAFYGSLASTLTGNALLFTEHGELTHPRPRKRAGFKLRAITALKAQFTAVSEFSAQQLIARGVPAKRLRVIYNPAPEIKKPQLSKSELRAALGLPEKEFLWVQLASLQAVKDQSTLLRAFARLNSQRSANLLILGEGPEREKLEQLRNTLGLEARVFMPGFKRNIPEYLSAADAFVLSSRSEALPFSLLEAAACGLPIVSTEVGGIPEILSKAGEDPRFRLCPPADEESLAAAMLKTQSNQQGDGSNLSSGFALAEKFRLFQVTKAYLDTYAEITDFI